MRLDIASHSRVSALRSAVATWLLVVLALPLAAETLEGRVVGVKDGDSLVVLVDERPIEVRLAEIDTPERGQPWGRRAKQALADLVFGEEVAVETRDVDRYGRIVARVWQGERDVNRELVADGHAWVYRRYLEDRSLLEIESLAREAERGLWSLDEPAVPPWEWRRGTRPAKAAPPSMDRTAFACGAKRYCREMRSCAEARYHLAQCGLARLDGDGDGIPCEQLCR